MGAFDDLATVETPREPTGELFADLAPPPVKKRQVGVGEAGARGVGQTFAEQGNVLSLAASAPAIALDKAISALTGKTVTGAQDWMFGNVVDPAKRAVDYYKPDAATEELGTGAKIANVGGRIVGMAPSMIASGGAGGVVPIIGARGALNIAVEKAIQSAPKLVQHAVQGAVVAQPSFAIPGTVTRAQELLEGGVDPNTVLGASVANWLTNTAQGALPMAMPGRLLTRAATGAGVNVGAGAAGRAIEGQVLGPEYAEQQQPAFSAEGSGLEAGVGALMAALFGGRGAPAARPTPKPRPEPTLEPIEPRQPPPPPEHIDAGPLGIDPETAARAASAALHEGADTSAAPNLKLVPEGTPTPTGQGFPTEVRPAPVAPDWTLSEPSAPRDTRLTGERVADAAARVGETPESVARSFDIAYGQRGPAVEAATQASNLPPLDADSLRVIQEHMGVPPEQTLALGANSQRRLLAAAMKVEAENAARAAKGPLAAIDIKAQDEGAGPASPASRPNVPGDRPAPEARTFDQQAAAAEKPPDPAAVKRKAAMTEQLDIARKQLDAMRSSETFAGLRRRRDAGERLSENESKLLNRLEAQHSKLGQTIFDLESKIYETEAKSEAGSRSASGTSDRPFRAADAGPAEGPPTQEQAQQRAFRDTAEQRARDAQKEALDKLEAEWRARQEARRERAANEEARARRGEGAAGERYRNAPRSPNAAKEQDGNFRVDPEGHVMSDKGAPIWFAHQRDAGWWILRTGNKQAPGKVYQIANHPSGDGFTVQVTGDSSPGGGRRGGGGGEPGGGGGGGNAEGIRGNQGPNREGGGGGQPLLQQGAVNRGGDIQQAAPRPPTVEPPRPVDSAARERAPEAPPVAPRAEVEAPAGAPAQEAPRAAVEAEQPKQSLSGETFASARDRIEAEHPNVDFALGHDQKAKEVTVGLWTLKKGAPENQGHGQAALRALTEWADANGQAMRLIADPIERQGRPIMPLAKLEEIYGRFGFVKDSKQGIEGVSFMTRKPGAKEANAKNDQRPNPQGHAGADAPVGRARPAVAEGAQSEGAGGIRPAAAPERAAAAAEPEAPPAKVTPEAEHESNIRSWIKSFRSGIGRDEVGGRLIIDEVNRHRVPGSGDVLGRTVHTGDPMWFGRPDVGLSANAARNAIDKFLDGKRLGAREQRYIDYLREHAEIEERGIAEGLRADPELQRADVEEVARAEEVLPPERVDELVDEHDAGRLSEDDFYDELSRRIDDAEKQSAAHGGAGETPEAEAARAGAAEGRGAGRPGGEPDFGLEQPTPEQLREREQQRADGERAAEREGQRAERARQRELDAAELKAREERVRKERADAAAEDFQLGQEPPRKTVNRDEAAGQKDMLDQPAAVGADVRARQAGEARAADEGRWTRLMEAADDARAEAVAKEMTPEQARAALKRLDAAPGDNPRARAALEAVANGRDTGGGPGGTLYGGLPLGEMFKWLGRGVERITGPASEWKDTAIRVKDMAQHVADALTGQGKHIFGKTPGESPLGNVFRYLTYNDHSHIVAFGKHWNSPTIQKIADMIYPTAGKAQPEQAFHEASEAHVARRQQQLEGMRVEGDRLNKLGVTDDQIIRMIENPRARQGKAGELAARWEQWFKEERAYQRAAGVDIGEVTNYFPREYDRSKIIPKRAEFIKDATRAYEKMGLPPDEAARAADAFWYRRTYGADGTPSADLSGAGSPLFTKSREFTPEAARELEDWRVKSLSDTGEAYLARSTRLAEIHRRFGYSQKELQAMRDRGGASATTGKEGAWGKWGEMEKQIHKEAPDLHEEEIHQLRAMVASAMGFRPPTTRSAIHQGAQWLRMATAFATMPKSAFSSIGESVAPIFRSNGDVAVAATQLRNVLYENVKSLLKQAAGEGRTEHMKRLFDFGEDIGVLVDSAMASPMRDRWLGDDVTNKKVSGMTAKFFKLNMLDQLTNWQRAIGIDAARVFMRRQAMRATEGGKAGAFFLKELGIPEAKVAEFSAFVRKLGDDLPDASMLGGEMGQLYRNAQVRFSDQSIQRPNAATRPQWANSDLGSVIFQLQGFAHAYHKNVLLRQKNLMMEAVKGDYTTAERAQLMGGMVPGMILSAAVAGLVWEIRDRLYNKTPPDRSMRAKIERAVSASGGFGALDPYLQYLGGLRYQRPLSAAVAGPAIGSIESTLTALGNYTMNNTDATNTAERRVADATYQWLIEPAATAMLAASPAPVRPLTQALTVYAIPAARQHFVDAVAGPRKKKPQQIRGITEGRAPPKSEMTFQQRLEAERSAAR